MIEEKTFSVTIKTLVIDNKKMTLSIFKQLPLKLLFKTEIQKPLSDGYIISTREKYFIHEFIGNPLGIVNVGFDKINKWVLMECDGKLFRCALDDRHISHLKYHGKIENAIDNEIMGKINEVLKIDQIFIGV